jgi:Family of unknown function (DUF5908)
MPVKINLLQITSTVQEDEGDGQPMALEQLDARLAELERRMLQECTTMILEALEKQQER